MTPSSLPRPLRDSARVQALKQSLFSLGENVVDNPLTARVVAARTIDREALLGGHPAVEHCIRYGTEETTRFRPPAAAGDLPPAIVDAPERVRIERPFVCGLRDVQLVGPAALTMPPTGGVVLENALGYPRRVTFGAVQALRDGTLPKRGSTTRHYDVGLSLAGPWCYNYFHWLVDYVARLRGIEPYVERTGRAPTLLLPPDCSDWMRSALRLAGFDEADWSVLRGGRVGVDRLVVPSLSRGQSDYFDLEDNRNIYSYSPGAIRWLRTTFRSNLEDPDVEGPERIYVSRENASERRVQNRDALEGVLEDYGFESIRPERHSVPEQVAIFSEAEAVMGPTGAGLVNAIFADDCRLVTLFGSLTLPIYYVLGSLLDFDVGYVHCGAVGADLHVDPDDLRAVLDDLGVD